MCRSMAVTRSANPQNTEGPREEKARESCEINAEACSSPMEEVRKPVPNRLATSPKVNVVATEATVIR